jgi:hypothetical protein
MRTETGKSAKITPFIHINRELVDIFQDRLDNAFKTMLDMKLNMHCEATRLTLPAAAPVKGCDPEDIYDLSEIMEIAAELKQENCKGTPLTLSEITSDEPLPLVFSSATNRSSGTTSAVLLTERTAEALPMTPDNRRKTSDVPSIFICLFTLYYDVIPSRHLSSFPIVPLSFYLLFSLSDLGYISTLI